MISHISTLFLNDSLNINGINIDIWKFFRNFLIKSAENILFYEENSSKF
jgi:hypothetical protein